MLQHISFLDYGPNSQDQPENPANTYNNSGKLGQANLLFLDFVIPW